MYAGPSENEHRGMSLAGPTLPTWAMQQVGVYPGYTGPQRSTLTYSVLMFAPE
jgi:hypothetical protein